MPTATEELWLALENKDGNKINELLRNHPNGGLVNSLIEESNSFAMAFFNNSSREVKSPENVRLVMAQPDLNFTYVCPDNRLDLTGCIVRFDGGSTDLVTSLKDKKEFLNGGVKTAYERALDGAKDITKFYNSALKRKPVDQARVDKLAASVKHRGELALLLRDISIINAVATDDVDFLNRLESAGAEPLKPLGEYGKNQSFDSLLKQHEGKASKVGEWYQSKLAAPSASASSSASAGSNPHAFMNPMQMLRQLEEAKRQAKLIQDEEQVKLMGDKAGSNPMQMLRQLEEAKRQATLMRDEEQFKLMGDKVGSSQMRPSKQSDEAKSQTTQARDDAQSRSMSDKAGMNPMQMLRQLEEAKRQAKLMRDEEQFNLMGDKANASSGSKKP